MRPRSTDSSAITAFIGPGGAASASPKTTPAPRVTRRLTPFERFVFVKNLANET
jgi:hypothetical protein